MVRQICPQTLVSFSYRKIISSDCFQDCFTMYPEVLGRPICIQNIFQDTEKAIRAFFDLPQSGMIKVSTSYCAMPDTMW